VLNKLNNIYWGRSKRDVPVRPCSYYDVEQRRPLRVRSVKALSKQASKQADFFSIENNTQW